MHTFLSSLARAMMGLIFACAALPAVASDYTLVQELSAIASGDGEPGGLFGLSVAVDGDLAVAASAGSDGAVARKGVIRTYKRNGTNWTYVPGHDIELNARIQPYMSFNSGKLAIAGYNTDTSIGFVKILRYSTAGWTQEHGFTTNLQVSSIATTDSIAVVGAPTFKGVLGYAQGLIYILRRQGDGTWQLASQLPSTPQAGAYFGSSVAIVAGAIVVGAPEETVTAPSGTYVHAGAAYVYELTQNTWSEVARLVEPDVGNRTNYGFGFTAAISGADPSTPDRMLIGNDNSAGRLIRSYRRIAGTWTPGFTISTPHPGTNDTFGRSLAMDGDWAVIGAPTTSTVATNAGAIFLAKFSNNFTSVQSLTERADPQAGADDELGRIVDIDRVGPTVIVGSYLADLYGNENQGVVLVGRSVTAAAPLLTRAIDLGQGLTGASAGLVAIDGDTLMIGAAFEDVGIQQSRGAVYVYRRQQDGTYAFESRLLAPDGTEYDDFGYRIALKGDVALVSAVGRSLMAVEGAGAVYAFHRDGIAWTLEAQFLPPADGLQPAFGRAVAFDGTTAMVGGFIENTTVLERSDNGMWITKQDIPHLATAVQVDGDVAMLGGAIEDNDYIGEVAIYARVGGVWQPDGVLSGSDVEQQFGYGIVLDGNNMAIASAKAASPVQIFQRNANGWLPQASLLPNDSTATTMCSSVSLRGSRLALGCFEDPTGIHSAVYVFEKVAGMWSQSQKLALPNPVDYDRFGFSLAWPDQGSLLASSYFRNVDFADQGAVYLFQNDVLFQNGFE